MNEYASDREIALESLRVLQGIDERLTEKEFGRRTAEVILDPALCRWDTAPEVYGSARWNLQTFEHWLVSFDFFVRNNRGGNEVRLSMQGDFVAEVEAKFASPYPESKSKGIDYMFREPVFYLKSLPHFYNYQQYVLLNSPILGSSIVVACSMDTITIKYYIEASLIGTIEIKGAP